MEEGERDVLQWAACVKQNLLVLCYLHDVKVCELFSVMCVLLHAIITPLIILAKTLLC